MTCRLSTLCQRMAGALVLGICRPETSGGAFMQPFWTQTVYSMQPLQLKAARKGLAADHA